MQGTQQNIEFLTHDGSDSTKWKFQCDTWDFHCVKTSEHYLSTFLHVKKYPTFYEVLLKKQRQRGKKKKKTNKKTPIFAQT